MRSNRRVAILSSLVALVLAMPAAAQLAGTWTGTHESDTLHCTVDVQSSGPMKLVLTQNGNAFSGTMETGFHRDVDRCGLLSTPSTFPTANVSGTVSGNSFSGVVKIGTEEFGPITGSVNGTAMTFTWTLPTDSDSDPDDGPIDTIFRATVTRTTGAAAPAIVSFTATPPTIPLGSPARLAWVTTNATEATIDRGVTARVVSGSAGVTPTATTTYTLTATGPGGPAVTATVTVTVTAPVPPAVTSFTATPASITTGDPSTLSWATTNATGVTIDNGAGTRAASGTLVVRPPVTTTYTLTATGAGGTSAPSRVTVTVTPRATPADVVISDYPDGMVHITGGPLPADSFTLTNTGGTTTHLTFELGTNPFFTLRPATIDLAPRSSQTVFVTALDRSEQFLSADVRVNGDGAGLTVPIRLLNRTPPATPVAITADPRSELVAPAGQNPSGQVVFTNTGTQPILGIVTADVPWLVLSRFDLNIQPGQGGEMEFSINRARRSDSDAPTGAAIGTLTFSYVNLETIAGSGLDEPVGFATSPVVSKVSVVIIDVVTLGTVSGLPPLPPGQFAYLIPGASSTLTAGDLVLTNTNLANIGDLTMYFAPLGGAPGTTVSIPQFKANSGILFPGVVKNIFKDLPQKTGTLHVRSASALAKVSVAQTQVDTKRGLGYALPVFRSSEGAEAGQSVLLPGVQSSAAMSTSLFLQETVNQQATVVIDALDAQGAVKAGGTQQHVFNGQLELFNAVPAGTATVRITNNSASGARVDAFALVTDKTTTDAHTIVQVGPVTDPMYVPAFDPGAGTMTLHLTNSSASPISVTATTIVSGPRRRSITADAAPPPVAIPSLGYVEVPVTGRGFVRLTGSTAVRGAGRLAIPSGGGNVGAGITMLPASRAKTSMRFAGIEDSSATTIDRHRNLTYRTNLMLIETTGNAVTVKLTLHYTFSSGKVTAGTVSSETFVVPANGFALIDELARSIIGVSRDAYGDLHNAVLDIEVTEGGGAFLAFLQVIDNGSGDVTVRHE
jgi:hypothetical protein